jgi:hypothetical protein
MNGDEVAEQRREATGWLAIAREDVRVVRACLALDPPAFGMAAYHCQQAAEKLTKGLLAAAGVAFRKTHDLDELADLAAAYYPPARQVLDAIPTSHRVGFRVSLSDHGGQCRASPRRCRFAPRYRHPRRPRRSAANRYGWRAPGARPKYRAWRWLGYARDPTPRGNPGRDVVGYSRRIDT